MRLHGPVGVGDGMGLWTYDSISDERDHDFALILLLLVVKGLKSSSNRYHPPYSSPTTLSSLSSSVNH